MYQGEESCSLQNRKSYTEELYVYKAKWAACYRTEDLCSDIRSIKHPVCSERDCFLSMRSMKKEIIKYFKSLVW